MTSGPAADRSDRLGARGMPARLLVLTGAVTLTALVSAMVGWTLPFRLPADDPLGGPARFGIAVAILAVAQLARLRFRTGAGTTRRVAGWTRGVLPGQARGAAATGRCGGRV